MGVFCSPDGQFVLTYDIEPSASTAKLIVLCGPRTRLQGTCFQFLLHLRVAAIGCDTVLRTCPMQPRCSLSRGFPLLRILEAIYAREI